MLRASSSLVRREVYADVGLFDDAYDLRADIEMWLRISRSYPIGIIDRHLFRYRWGHENVSQSYERLRDSPELTFALLDQLLDRGDSAIAAPNGTAGFEGRELKDLLIVSANLYTLDRRSEGRSMLARASPRRLLATGQVQRTRLARALGPPSYPPSAASRASRRKHLPSSMGTRSRLMTSSGVALFIDPIHARYERDRLSRSRPERAPATKSTGAVDHIRERFGNAGVAVHTADLLEDGIAPLRNGTPTSRLVPCTEFGS